MLGLGLQKPAAAPTGLQASAGMLHGGMALVTRTDADQAKLQLAKLGLGRGPKPASSSDDEEKVAELPPGPVVAEKCTLGGPGFAGGSAGAPVTFKLQARDARGTRLIEGGCWVTARCVAGSKLLPL